MNRQKALLLFGAGYVTGYLIGMLDKIYQSIERLVRQTGAVFKKYLTTEEWLA